MSMPKRLLGKSRTWPLQATTSYSGPRYLLIVLALVGDSTMTRFFFFRVATGGSSLIWRWPRTPAVGFLKPSQTVAQASRPCSGASLPLLSDAARKCPRRESGGDASLLRDGQ